MTKQELSEDVIHGLEEFMKKERALWYERGKRDGREEVKSALRDLLDIKNTPQLPD